MPITATALIRAGHKRAFSLASALSVPLAIAATLGLASTPSTATPGAHAITVEAASYQASTTLTTPNRKPKWAEDPETYEPRQNPPMEPGPGTLNEIPAWCTNFAPHGFAVSYSESGGIGRCDMWLPGDPSIGYLYSCDVTNGYDNSRCVGWRSDGT
jgi:hypothetical protein